MGERTWDTQKGLVGHQQSQWEPTTEQVLENPPNEKLQLVQCQQQRWGGGHPK